MQCHYSCNDQEDKACIWNTGMTCEEFHTWPSCLISYSHKPVQ